ncbi:unnamed protein product, partial [Notodromas monacha]
RGRAVEIDSRSRVVENGLNFLKLCNENAIAGLEIMLEEFMVLDMIVYEAAPGVEISYQEFSELDDLAKIELMMSETKDEDFLRNFSTWLRFYFDHNSATRTDFESRFEILRKFALKLCESDVGKARKVIEACKKDRGFTIPDTDKFAALVIECVYACERWEDLPKVFNMADTLNSLMGATGSQSSGFPPMSAKMRREASRADEDLKAADMTTSVGVPLVPRHVASLRDDAELVRDLMVKICRLPISRKPPFSKMDWFNLLQQIQNIRKIGFPDVLTPKEVSTIWIKSLLVSSNHDLIRIAGDRLSSVPATSGSDDGKLTYAESVKLCLEASREYLDACASATGPNVALAAECLALVGPGSSPEVARDMKLIESLPVLSQYGVKLLPVQIRLKPDKLDVIREVLRSDVSAYSKPQKVLDLAFLLVPPANADDEKNIKGKVFTILAEKAFQVKDFSVCSDLCNILAKERHAGGWEVCGKFGSTLSDMKIDAARAPGLRAKLLSFAMAHCPPDKIHEYLQKSSQTEVDFSDVLKPQDNVEWKAPLEGSGEDTKKLHSHPLETRKFCEEERLAEVRYPCSKRGADLGWDFAVDAVRTAFVDLRLGNDIPDVEFVKG